MMDTACHIQTTLMVVVLLFIISSQSLFKLFLSDSQNWVLTITYWLQVGILSSSTRSISQCDMKQVLKLI